jgi:hypothetical protein
VRPARTIEQYTCLIVLIVAPYVDTAVTSITRW